MFEMIQMFLAAILFASSMLFSFFAMMLATDLIIDLISKLFIKIKKGW